MCLKKNGSGLMQDSIIPYNVCLAFSWVCSAVFIFIHCGQYLHDSPGNTIHFKAV